MSRLLIIAAALGLLGVAAGTFGAHLLPDYLEARFTPERIERLSANWETASRYHMYHALALLGLALADARWRRRSILIAAWLFTSGILIFSGSLYVLTLTDLRWLGAVTPIGGACFLAGWLSLIIAGVRRPSKPLANQ